MKTQLINIFLLGIAFMILITAFTITTQLAQSVLEGMKNETVNGTGFHGSGYISQAILHVCYAIANIFAPMIVSIFGPAVTMFLGGTAYFLYTLSYISPMIWSYYVVPVLLGFGAAILWNGQGVYLTVNSDDTTISRNTGIFWAFYQSSLLPGNIYIYLSLKTEIIDRSKRYPLFSIFSVVSAIGLVVFILIIWRSYMERRRDTLIKVDEGKKDTLTNVLHTLKTAGRLLKTRNMLLLTIISAYLGLSPAFYSTVYSTCIGHYKKYGDTRKRFIGLHGIFLGVGGVLGGGLFGFLTKPKTSSQRALIVLIGFVLQMIYYYSVFVNYPSDASTQETDTKPYIDFSSRTSQVITFIGSFIVGLGDSSLNTQLMNILAGRYKETAASAFAIYKFVHAAAVATTLFYAGFLPIQWQLLIVVTFLFIATLAFFSVLFDDKTSEKPTFEIIQENHNENVSYQCSVTSSIR